MIQYFPKPYKSFEENINVKVDQYIYGIKADTKHILHVDTSNFELKSIQLA